LLYYIGLYNNAFLKLLTRLCRYTAAPTSRITSYSL